MNIHGPSSLLLLVFLFPLVAEAQKNEQEPEKGFEITYTYKKRKKLAKQAYNQGSYYDAIDFYEEMNEERPNNMEVAYQLAQSYRQARDYENAANTYQKVLNVSDIHYPLARYYKAMMVKMQGKYQEALQEFKTFSKDSLSGKYAKYHQFARQEIQNCQYGREQQQKQHNYIVHHLDSTINHPFTEFAPAVLGDSLFVFSSLNNDQKLNRDIDDQGFFSHVYIASRQDSEWVNTRPLPKPINDVDHHSGNGSFSADGKRFYFTKCKTLNKGRFDCDIYISEFANGSWYRLTKLSDHVNQDSSNNTHPAVAPHPAKDKDVLYFVSNRKGGQGRKDIWVTTVHRNGKAAKPKNLGSIVNTSRNEHSPFYDHEDSTLYFSSKGHLNLGGYDIFRTSKTSNEWEEPANIGMPFNSSADDMYYTKGESPRKSYLISNRPGTFALKSPTCCDDIFAIKPKEQPTYYINANVYPKGNESNTPMSGVYIKLMDADSPQNNVLFEDTTTGKSPHKVRLQPNKNYQVQVNKPDFFSETFDVSTKGLEHSHTFQLNVALEKMQKDKVYSLNNIYYDFGSAQLRSESKEELHELYKLLTNNPGIMIEIRAHTDSIGSQAKNLKLSQKRAENVADYLQQKGIDGDRLKPKGYGEVKPIATNKTEKGRQQNRRTEFKILGKSNNFVNQKD